MPITAAITLAGASFSGAASEPLPALPKEPRIAEAAARNTYPATVITSLLAFVETLTKHQEFMPTSSLRLAVFSELEKDGALAAVPLSQLEKRTLLLCAEYGTDSVTQGLLKAHADVRNGTINEASLFGRVVADSDPRQIANPSDVAGEYQKGLRVLYLLAGIGELHKEQASSEAALRYVVKSSPARATLLVTLLGAAQMQQRLSLASPATPLTRQFVQAGRRSVTDEDVRAIPQLGHIQMAADNRIAVTTLVTSLTGAMFFLYRRIRSTAQLVESIDARNESTTDELLPDVDSHNDKGQNK